MSINNLNTYLNVRDAHLRVVSGNVYAQAMNIGGINVETAHGLQSVSNTGNATSLTLEFANVTTGFVTTANAQIGRDLVVTGNATVSKELTVTSNAIVSSNLNVSDDLIVTNNILASNNLTVTGNLNVTTIRSDSNVVAEYTGPHDRPLRKYPEVKFPLSTSSESPANGATTFTFKSYTVTGNSVYNDATSKISNAFDGEEHVTSWTGLEGDYDSNGDVASGRTANYLQIQLPNAIKLERMKIISDGNYQYANGPRNITLYGSINGSNWVTLKTETDLPLDGGTTNPDPQTAFVHVNTTTKYLYYKLEISKIWISSGGATYARIGEWELYGYEEGSGSLDTTLKSVYNVPATTGTQLEVYYDAKDLTDGAVTSVTDLSPNSNYGSPSDSPQISNGAFVFDGVNDYIYNSRTGYTASSVYTASTWVKFLPDAGSSSDPCIFQFGNGSNHSSFGMISDTSENRIRAFIFGNNAVDIDERVDNVWYHLCATYYASNGRTDFFINGILKGSVTSGTAITIPSTPYLSIGVQTNSLNAPISTTYFTGSIANFRLYSKALNADQVKELYDYQKDYFLGSKSQVTLYKGHLGVGVTEPSGQLELAGDERIQEYPPRGFGVFAEDPDYNTYIEGHGVFTAYGSSQNNTGKSYSVIGAFDKTLSPDSSCWLSKAGTYSTGNPVSATAAIINGIQGEFIALKSPYPIKLKSFTTQVRGGVISENVRMAKSGIIWGSNNGATWYQVHSWSGRVYSDGNPNYFEVNSTEYYSHHALQTTETQGNVDATVIGEWRLFGTPGPATLDKGSLSLTRSLDVPRVSRYDVDTETPRPEKLVLDLDTTVNDSPTDISGKGNHGKFVGNAQYSPADKAFTGFPSSSANYINGTLNGVSGAYAHTQSYWVNGADTTPRAAFTVGKDISTTREFLNIWFTTSKWVLNADGATTSGEWAETIHDNRWYHVVLTYDGGSSASSYKLYINGEYKTPTTAITASTTLNLPSNPEYRIGRNNGTQWYNGMVSNPKVYSVVLEPSEVRKLYKLGRTGRSMVISDTAVGIGKAPEAQLDVRGILKASIGLFPDRPSFMCPVALFGAKSIPTSTTMYDYSTRDGLTLSNRSLSTTAMRWKLGDNGGRHTNTMYPTNNVNLVRVFDDTTSETSGVQVPYEGYYLCHNFVRSNAGGYNMGNSFITYSESQQKYITASINAYMLPWGGGHSGQSTDYMMQFVSAVLYLRPNDKVIFSFWNQTSYSGGFEQYVSLVML